MSRFCNQNALKCGSGLQDPLFPRFAIAGEESAYRVKGDVLHPSLVAVRREGESNSFEPFVRRYERLQGFGLEVLRSLDFHGNDGRPFLHKEIDFHGGIGRATLFPTNFRPNTTFFPTSFKSDYTLFSTSLGNVGGGVDCIAGLVEERRAVPRLGRAPILKKFIAVIDNAPLKTKTVVKCGHKGDTTYVITIPAGAKGYPTVARQNLGA